MRCVGSALYLALKAATKFLHHVALVGRIELHDAHVAERRLAGLLLEAERQPDRADLDRAAAAAFDDAGLRQRLGDLQALPFQRVGRDHVDLAEPGDARRDRGEVVDVAAEADVREHFAAELDEGLLEHLALPMPALVFSYSSTAVRALSRL